MGLLELVGPVGWPMRQTAAKERRTWLSTHLHHGIEDIIFVLRGADVMAAFRGATQTRLETK